jgi:hypothetical protein
MAPRRHLSDRTLRALAPAKAGTRYELRDSIVAGFGVRVNDERDPSRPGKAGHVSFILYTRFPGSKAPTRRALGRYGKLTLEQARDKAAQWRALISRGIDPTVEEERARLAEQRKRANTFAAVPRISSATRYRRSAPAVPLRATSGASSFRFGANVQSLRLRRTMCVRLSRR